LFVHLTVYQFPLAAFRRPDSKSYRGYPSALQTSRNDGDKKTAPFPKYLKRKILQIA
jgi:hypothetical protein